VLHSRRGHTALDGLSSVRLLDNVPGRNLGEQPRLATLGAHVKPASTDTLTCVFSKECRLMALAYLIRDEEVLGFESCRPTSGKCRSGPTVTDGRMRRVVVTHEPSIETYQARALLRGNDSLTTSSHAGWLVASM
jgi:hypothetical protein